MLCFWHLLEKGKQKAGVRGWGGGKGGLSGLLYGLYGLNLGALIIGIGLWGPLYHSYRKQKAGVLFREFKLYRIVWGVGFRGLRVRGSEFKLNYHNTALFTIDPGYHNKESTMRVEDHAVFGCLTDSGFTVL